MRRVHTNPCHRSHMVSHGLTFLHILFFPYLGDGCSSEAVVKFSRSVNAFRSDHFDALIRRLFGWLPGHIREQVHAHSVAKDNGWLSALKQTMKQ